MSDLENDVLLMKRPVIFVKPEVCTWIQGMFRNLYTTECGHEHYLELGTATEYGFNFCPFCGKPIKDVPFADN